MPVPAYVSDVGKVLIDFDFQPAAKRLAEKCPFPAEAVLRCFDEIKGPYEEGRLSDAEFIAESIRRTGFRGTQEEFIRIWCEIFTENTPMRSLLASLAGKVPLYLLSNTSGLHVDYFLRSYPEIFRHFSGGVYSHEAHCAKPGAEIFHHTIQRFDLDPARSLYVDDLLPNIKTAANLGFQVFHYHFDRHAELLAVVKAWQAEQRIG